jgi:hypothetical protein
MRGQVRFSSSISESPSSLIALVGCVFNILYRKIFATMRLRLHSESIKSTLPDECTCEFSFVATRVEWERFGLKIYQCFQLLRSDLTAHLAQETFSRSLCKLSHHQIDDVLSEEVRRSIGHFTNAK